MHLKLLLYVVVLEDFADFDKIKTGNTTPGSQVCSCFVHMLASVYGYAWDMKHTADI